MLGPTPVSFPRFYIVLSSIVNENDIASYVVL